LRRGGFGVHSSILGEAFREDRFYGGCGCAGAAHQPFAFETHLLERLPGNDLPETIYLKQFT
jgi:hypothetical protein